MLKVKSGNTRHLEVLYARYSRRLFGFFYRMTGDGATSEDLVQNVFMRILRYKHSYSDTGNFESWVFHMARNVHKDDYRKTKRYFYKEEMEDLEKKMDVSESIEVSMESNDEVENLKKALKALSDEKRELIELTRFQHLKYEQVAQMLGTTEGAIKVRVHRIMNELKENYQRLDG